MKNEAIKLNGIPAVNEAQVKTRLNSTMLRLKTEYGFAPAKDITVEEMRQRCDEVAAELGTAIETYVKEAGKRPDIMRNTSPYKVSKDFPAKKYDGLQAHANVPDDRLRKAPLYTQEGIGNLLTFNAEYLLRASHQEEIANRTRKDWQRLEYEYVERSDFNLRDLHNDLLERINEPGSGLTLKFYKKERKKWRNCGCYSCDNYFPTTKNHFKAQSRYWTYKNIEDGRSNSLYCSKSCRKNQENALVRLQKTGTLLPETTYRYVLDDYKERVEKKHVTSDPTFFDERL
ncbi:hypothetical protein [Priestia megaterium]|uniref:hypothetical protein n=1 Tax=Priestia megaterium TaxID=1404 RepID=UPI00317455D0